MKERQECINYLDNSTNIFGRTRRTGIGEQDRKWVSRAIHGLIQRINPNDPELARHFLEQLTPVSEPIKYAPDEWVDWNLG